LFQQAVPTSALITRSLAGPWLTGRYRGLRFDEDIEWVRAIFLGRWNISDARATKRTPALSRTAGEKLGLFGSGLVPDDQRLDEAQDVPGREKCQALEREAFELVQELGDQESDGERARLLSQKHFDAQCLDE
jgi:hypothetical protein